MISRRPSDPNRQMAAGDVVLDRLAAMRRRVALVLAIRYGLLAGAICLVAIQAVIVGFGLGTLQALTVLLIGTGLAAAAAVGTAFLRLPTLVETAAIVDRRQRLESRATTALQFAAGSDPVSRLVVADAAGRLSGLAPAQVFPVEYPRRAPWIVSTVAVASLLLGLALSRGSLPARMNGAPGGPSAAPAQARSAPGAPPDAVPSPEPGHLESQSPGIPISGAEGQAASARSAVEAAAEQSVVETAAQGAQPSSPVQDAMDPGGLAASAAQASRESPAAPAVRSETPSLSPGAADEVLAARGGSGDGSGTGGPGAGGAAGSGTTRGAGGVKDGSVIDGTPGARAPTAPVPGAGRYGATAAGPQAAVALERVPPALRQYVRDYFDAIRRPQP